MKSKIISIIVLLSLSMATTKVSGQMGKLIGASDFSITDMMQLSQYNYQFGTARSAAMGGAFVSLGADLSSMSLNPAGLGLYRSSDFGLSPSLTISKVNNVCGSLPQGYERFTRFTLNNIGAALNVYQSSGDVTSVTIGFGYNKLADFNYTSLVDMNGESASITDVFAQQLRGIRPGDISSVNGNNTWYNHDPRQWGAILGYQTFAVNFDENSPAGTYNYMPNLGDDAVTNNWMTSYVNGSIGEYNFSVGVNMRNKFYWGFSIGMQSILYRETIQYSERYIAGADVLDTDLAALNYDQYVKMSGVGVNFKFGAIYQPIEGLRMGMAFHTPSLLSLERVYQAGNMYTRLENGDDLDGLAYSDELYYQYNLSTPPRLMVGASYSFQNFFSFAVDYERIWYNGMRILDEDMSPKEYMKGEVKYYFKGSNNVRTGIEIKPAPFLALRGGFAYYGSGLKNDKDMFDKPTAIESMNYSAGIGLKFNNYYVDFAYILSDTKYSDYDLFYYNGKNNSGNDVIITTNNPITQSIKRNTFTLSMGVRF